MRLLCLLLYFVSSFAKSRSLLSIPSITKASIMSRAKPNADSAVAAPSATYSLPPAVKMIIGAGGIYASFLYYGTLQEEVFAFTAPDGTQFKSAWFLQALEALANVVVGGIGMQLSGHTPNLPLDMFAYAGASQVCSKAFTSFALAEQVSFPVVTLAKSGKMIPVMLGTLLFGGKNYTWKEYLAVVMIIAGTTMVSLGKKAGKGGDSSQLGLLYIVLSLSCDGITGGLQNALKAKAKKLGVTPKVYDFMFWTNFFMMLTASVIALFVGDIQSGLTFCSANPSIIKSMLIFATCSAIGQSFIFYTISNFDSLFCSTVTTTRKIFSVLLSIFLHGHSVSTTGWFGIAIASTGIMSELVKETTRPRDPEPISLEANREPGDATPGDGTTLANGHSKAL